MGQNPMPGVRIWLTDAGTSETPKPAATIGTMEVICGASCPFFGRNPAASQAAIVRSYNAGLMSRGKRMNSSCASAESGTRSRAHIACPSGNATTIGSSTTGRLTIPGGTSNGVRTNAASTASSTSAFSRLAVLLCCGCSCTSG